MAQRLVGLVILLGILLIFAPWLYKINPPVDISIPAIPNITDMSPVIVPAPSPPRLPTNALLSALGVDDTDRASVKNVVPRKTKQTTSSRPSAPNVEHVSASKQPSKVPVSRKPTKKSSARADKTYRIRIGVFRRPEHALNRFKNAGYQVVQKKYRDTKEGPLYVLHINRMLTQNEANILSDELNHRYDIKTLIIEGK